MKKTKDGFRIGYREPIIIVINETSAYVAEILFVDGIHLVYKMRNNMRGGEIPLNNELCLENKRLLNQLMMNSKTYPK